MRIENNIEITTKLMEIENDKLNNLQSELVKLIKFNEQEQREYNLIQNVCIKLLHVLLFEKLSIVK